MKILLATSKAIPSGGGIASYNQELVNLLGKDNEIVLLCDAHDKDVEGYTMCFTTVGHSLKDIIYCKKLIDKINAFGYDIIINSSSSFLPVISPFLNSPIISVSHFVNGKLAINAGYNSDYLSAIVALSHYGRNFILRKFNIKDNDKVKVIYNFVKHINLSSIKSKINETPLTIVYPGGTSIQKSVDVIQELAYKLLRSNLDFKFYWLGSTKLPSSKLTLLGLHETMDLFNSDHRLNITGLISREKALEIISSANIFLLPSRGEGCPMTLLEAMRGGCIPIVSDAHHGSREILKDAGVGFITKQNSARDIFEIITGIITNHSAHLFNYEKTRNYLNQSLSQEVWASAMRSIIVSACENGKRRIPFSKKAFKKSYHGYINLLRIERIKEIFFSIKYKVKLEIQYLGNLLGCY